MIAIGRLIGFLFPAFSRSRQARAWAEQSRAERSNA